MLPRVFIAPLLIAALLRYMGTSTQTRPAPDALSWRLCRCLAMARRHGFQQTRLVWPRWLLLRASLHLHRLHVGGMPCQAHLLGVGIPMHEASLHLLQATLQQLHRVLAVVWHGCVGCPTICALRPARPAELDARPGEAPYDLLQSILHRVDMILHSTLAYKSDGAVTCLYSEGCSAASKLLRMLINEVVRSCVAACDDVDRTQVT